MNLVSYQDYKSFKHFLIQGMGRSECAIFNAVVMKYLVEKFKDIWKKEIMHFELPALMELVQSVWDEKYVELDRRPSIQHAYSEFEKIGFDEDGNPDDLSPETIDVLSAVEYAVSEKYGRFDETIIYALELLSDDKDRELDEKYPDYVQSSLDNMFEYQEMRDLVFQMERAVKSIKEGSSPEYVLEIFQKNLTSL